MSCDDPVFRVGFNTAFMSENRLSAENNVTYAVGVQNKFMSVAYGLQGSDLNLPLAQ